MKGLLFLTLSPTTSNTTGATVNAKAAKPINALAHWYPSTLYRRLVANGNQAAIRFSPKPTALNALPANRLYASAM